MDHIDDMSRTGPAVVPASIHSYDGVLLHCFSITAAFLSREGDDPGEDRELGSVNGSGAEEEGADCGLGRPGDEQSEESR
jgi:hypothetical protein